MVAIKSCDHCGNDVIVQEIHLYWNGTSMSWLCERCWKECGGKN